MRLRLHSENTHSLLKEDCSFFRKDDLRNNLAKQPKKKKVFTKYPHSLAQEKNLFQISSANESNKLSIVECRKILCTEGINYTEQEISLIRDWLYHLADIAIDAFEKKEMKMQSKK